MGVAMTPTERLQAIATIQTIEGDVEALAQELASFRAILVIPYDPYGRPCEGLSLELEAIRLSARKQLQAARIDDTLNELLRRLLPKEELEGASWKVIVGKKAEGKEVDRWYVRRGVNGTRRPSERRGASL